MIPPELKQRVIDKVKESKQLAIDKLCLDIGTVVIKFDLTGMRAGVAHPSKRIIRLNESYLKDETEDMISQTIPHEVAHIVADNFYNRPCGHSYYWKKIMVEVFNLNPARTHLYGPPRDGSYNPHKKYELFCPQCGFRHWFKQTHYNRILKVGVHNCTCHRCRKSLIGAKITLDNS